MLRLTPNLCQVVLLAAWMVTTSPLAAQRVQFPSALPSGSTYQTPAPTLTPTPTPVLPSFDPYGNPLLGTPPANVPYNAAPQFGTTPAYGAAPQFGQPIAAPATPGVPQHGGSLYPNGVPFQWESGTYQYQNSDGSVARLQRFLQQISFEQTWLHGNQKVNELEINRTELSATFGVPIFYNPDTPLLITPGFAFNWLGGPLSGPVGSGDLPARVYDAYLDTAWYPQLTDWLHADLGFRTGVWTDFFAVNSDSVRLLGRGLGVLGISPQFDLLVGVWYLDRNDIKLLPAGGFHWRPNHEWDAYVVFPNPKVRKRFVTIGSSQWWWYVAGEYGGGRWTVERVGGMDDDIDINDIRVVLGLEWETQTQARGHLEVGYVWDREILYDTAPGKLKLDDTVMVRAGVDF